MNRKILRLAFAAATVVALAAPSATFAANGDGKGGSDAKGGAVAGDSYATKVKNFSYSGKTKNWTGKVKSEFSLPLDVTEGDAKVCTEGRHVTLFKKTKNGSDEVGDDNTNGKGKFSIHHRKKSGKKYFVVVDALEFVYSDYYGLDINGVCAKVKKNF